jgi:hypothetical protein
MILIVFQETKYQKMLRKNKKRTERNDEFLTGKVFEGKTGSRYSAFTPFETRNSSRGATPGKSCK